MQNTKTIVFGHKALYLIIQAIELKLKLDDVYIERLASEDDDCSGLSNDSAYLMCILPELKTLSHFEGYVRPDPITDKGNENQ